MLISFRAKNWKSFHSLEFSAVASKEQRHKDRIAVISRPKVRLLPISLFTAGTRPENLTFLKRSLLPKNTLSTGSNLLRASASSRSSWILNRQKN